MAIDNTRRHERRAPVRAGPDLSENDRPMARLRLLSSVSLSEAVALAAILVLAALLDTWRLDRGGYPNTYYAAAVKSMLQSWHNSFFVSFDPGGFVSVDKPPLGFWIQTASAKLFGFHGWSILLPQALAGVLSVAVLFLLVRRTFGRIAGLVAALALAITPVSVVTNRNNTIDSLLVFALLLAAWAAILAAERGSLRWLLWCAALVGIGFNIKMLEAYLVLPAFSLVYLLAAPHGWLKRILHLGLASIVLAVVSLSWAVVVDLTPAGQRPYVGSSKHNSELELAIGYNGLNRLLPGGMFPGGPPPGLPDSRAGAAGPGRQPLPAQLPSTSSQPFPPAPPTLAGPPASVPGGFSPPGGPPGGPGFGGETGQRGPLRLFNQQLAGQASWLIPLAILGLIAAWQAPLRRPPGRRQQNLMLWGLWFLTAAVFFSVAGFFHRYYLVTLAPAVAALVGAGIAALWNRYRRTGWKGWLLPVSLLATAAVQGSMLRFYPGWASWLTPLLAGGCAVAAGVLALCRLRPQFAPPGRIPVLAASGGMLALLLAPFVWSGITVRASSSGMLPAAGPAQNMVPFSSPGGPGALAGPPPGPGQEADSMLVSYLEANRGSARFLVAVPSSMGASPIILKTGEPVMAMGGFTGGDPILTTETLAQYVKNGTVRFFLVGGPPTVVSSLSLTAAIGAAKIEEGRGEGEAQAGLSGRAGALPPPGGLFPGPFGEQNALQNWITSHCSAVAAAAWRPASSTGSGFGFGGFGPAQQLYDCEGAA